MQDNAVHFVASDKPMGDFLNKMTRSSVL